MGYFVSHFKTVADKLKESGMLVAPPEGLSMSTPVVLDSPIRQVKIVETPKPNTSPGRDIVGLPIGDLFRVNDSGFTILKVDPHNTRCCFEGCRNTAPSKYGPTESYCKQHIDLAREAVAKMAVDALSALFRQKMNYQKVSVQLFPQQGHWILGH